LFDPPSLGHSERLEKLPSFAIQNFPTDWCPEYEIPTTNVSLSFIYSQYTAAYKRQSFQKELVTRLRKSASFYPSLLGEHMTPFVK